MTTTIDIPCAIGELYDKITILQIKSEKIKDEEKLKNVRKELEILDELSAKTNEIAQKEGKITILGDLVLQLKVTNRKIWVIEDDIRELERSKTFDESFVETARSVYINNDERCRIKRKINELLGSAIIEEKSYSEY